MSIDKRVGGWGSVTLASLGVGIPLAFGSPVLGIVMIALSVVTGGLTLRAWTDRQPMEVLDLPLTPKVDAPPRQWSRYAREPGTPWLVGIRRAIAECAVAARELENGRAVRGDEWFSKDLQSWVEDTDDLLACADAGDLLAAFRADEMPDVVDQQVAYLARQQRVFGDALARLRG